VTVLTRRTCKYSDDVAGARRRQAARLPGQAAAAAAAALYDKTMRAVHV